MGLIKRLQDILAANMGDAVESCENPEPLLKQAIREMEAAIADARRETARAMAAEKLAGNDLADSERQSADLQRRAEQAVLAGDDAQARSALARKQERDKVSAALRDQMRSAAEASGALRGQLDAMQAKLTEAKHRLGTLVARQKSAAARVKSADPTFQMEAFAKFDRMSEKVARVEAEAEALAELHRSRPTAAADDFPTQGAGPDVEAELAELKRKAGK